MRRKGNLPTYLSDLSVNCHLREIRELLVRKRKPLEPTKIPQEYRQYTRVAFCGPIYLSIYQPCLIVYVTLLQKPGRLSISSGPNLLLLNARARKSRKKQQQIIAENRAMGVNPQNTCSATVAGFTANAPRFPARCELNTF